MDAQQLSAEVTELRRQKEELRQLNAFYEAEAAKYKEEASDAKSKIASLEASIGKEESEQGKFHENLSGSSGPPLSDVEEEAVQGFTSQDILEEEKPGKQRDKAYSPQPRNPSPDIPHYNRDGRASPRSQAESVTWAVPPGPPAVPNPQSRSSETRPFYKTKIGRLAIALILIVILTIAIAVGVVVGSRETGGTAEVASSQVTTVATDSEGERDTTDREEQTTTVRTPNTIASTPSQPAETGPYIPHDVPPFPTLSAGSIDLRATCASLG
ncbi:hypothetical protein NMY22_g9772 [Coprinellus aureogranulatus]|nr:hypothetical protein NMY22_g9772 [Coprinellus aureogranulatus]